MKKTKAISGVAITAVALSLVLIGCGSGSNSTQKSATTTTTTEAIGAIGAMVAPRTENTAGPNPTIGTYIRENHIQETPIHRGDPGAPNINLPVPQGWADAPGDTPEWAYGAIVYTGPEAARYTPRIVVLMSKLTGNVDPRKIFVLAPGELNNLNGYKAINQGSVTTLAGHRAYQIAGTWVDNGQTKLVAQKTVFIRRSDGLYVLQLNADGLEDQMDIVGTATQVIDDQMTIT